MKGGGERLGVRALEPSLHEVLDQLLLHAPLLQGDIVVERRGHRSRLAIHHEGRYAVAVRGLQSVLELPLGSGDGKARDGAAELILRQQHAEHRPQDHDHHIAGAGRRNVLDVLEMAGRHERLALPHHRFDTKVIAEFAIQPLDDTRGDQPFWSHVGGRRNEDANDLRRRHGLARAAVLASRSRREASDGQAHLR